MIQCESRADNSSKDLTSMYPFTAKTTCAHGAYSNMNEFMVVQFDSYGMIGSNKAGELTALC